MDHDGASSHTAKSSLSDRYPDILFCLQRFPIKYDDGFFFEPSGYQAMRAALALIVLAACTTNNFSTSEQGVEAHERRQNVTRIRTNGQASDTLLIDPVTGATGGLNVSRDEIANTTFLDFSYVTPTSDPDIIILTQGAGEIPNSAYTQTDTTAHLLLNDFPTTSCTVNLITGEFTCAEGEPIDFDLTWAANGFSVVEERCHRTETIGPLTTRTRGEFVERSALVSGTWNGNSGENMSGHLTDTRESTVIREITMRLN